VRALHSLGQHSQSVAGQMLTSSHRRSSWHWQRHWCRLIIMQVNGSGMVRHGCMHGRSLMR
jgi:hypothetical protein